MTIIKNIIRRTRKPCFGNVKNAIAGTADIGLMPAGVPRNNGKGKENKEE